MAQIHILDSETIDKIAAGEVVERPCSVVKELVENAIDAGATAITVETRAGGTEMIRVTDNGGGMEREQIRMAFLRHATSKLGSAEDLSRISSLGFRGEALSSIAAVSKVEVITKTREDITGSRYLLEGAVEKGFEEIGAPDGTTFLVRNLFYNTPVRRRFLKQPATEGGYIAGLMEHLALSRPDISFKLILNGQMKFHTSGNGDLREVIYRIYGREVAGAMVPIEKIQEGIHIQGYLGKPVLVRSNRNFEIAFINGRFIRSSLVAKAVEEGYKEYLMQHKFPFCVLHLCMDTGLVDVNVHPTKMDVRFANGPDFVHFLAESVRNTLANREMIPEASLADDREQKMQVRQEHRNREKLSAPEPFEKNRTARYLVMEASRYTAPDAGSGEEHRQKDFQSDLVWARDKDTFAEKTGEPSGPDIRQDDQPKPDGLSAVLGRKPGLEIPPAGREQEPVPEMASEDFFTETTELTKEDSREDGTIPVPAPSQGPGEEAIRETPVPTQLNLFEEKILTHENRRRFCIIGQVFETYWLVQFEDRLLMIDQHAAHEKVHYERLMQQYKEKSIISQGLLPPVIVSLSSQEETTLKEYMATFGLLGFEVEPFGGSEYALRSVPVDLYGCGEREMFLEVLDQLGSGGDFGSIKVIEEKIASMACKAAVKGNNLLTTAEAQELIDELLTLENPYNCPHGRPTIVAMSKQEMDRKFKRIVG